MEVPSDFTKFQRRKGIRPSKHMSPLSVFSQPKRPTLPTLNVNCPLPFIKAFVFIEDKSCSPLLKAELAPSFDNWVRVTEGRQSFPFYSAATFDVTKLDRVWVTNSDLPIRGNQMKHLFQFFPSLRLKEKRKTYSHRSALIENPYQSKWNDEP